VSCTSNGDCDVTCHGDCTVACSGSGTCTMHCLDDGTCEIPDCVAYVGECDGVTSVCDGNCP
jgi:hypothetical protein